jgi:ribosomal protein S18 acetylase RimI-like enzyme
MDPFGNPIWFALQSVHATLAQGDETLLRYPADVAPFAAVARDGVRPSDAALAQAMQRPDVFYIVGAVPVLPSHVRVQPQAGVLQMVYAETPSPQTSGDVEVRELGDADLPAMLSLTSRVYPWFFRARTPVMGRYVGVFDDERLVAMGGERFRLEHACELSGICTDPDYVGRGYAGAIIRELIASILARGHAPFLHLAATNTRARSLYRALGFVERRELPMIAINAPA